MALVLAGCVPTTTVPYGIDLGDYEAAPRDLIAVDTFADDHIVRFAGGAGALGHVERERLAGFIGKIGANHPESLRVALHGRATPRQRKVLSALLVADGVNPQYIHWAGWHWAGWHWAGWHWAGRHSAGRHWVPPGAVVVAVERAVAVRPLCPGNFGHITSPNDNLPEPDLGCANTADLAVMVADPHDLRQASATIYSDGERAANTVALYRADKSKPLLTAPTAVFGAR